MSRHPILTAVLVVTIAFIVIAALGAMFGSRTTPRSSPSPSPTALATSPTPAPVTFPPTTLTAAKAWAAAVGHLAAVHEFSSTSVGAVGICPQPKRLATISQSDTRRQAAADLLRYFFQQGLDNKCGSDLLGYHPNTNTGGGFTAGQVTLEVSNGHHTLTVWGGSYLDQHPVKFTVKY